MMEKIKNYPIGVRIVIGKLWEAGYEAHMVGGCVRDALLGRTPGDWDVTTSATPAEVLEVFQAFRTVPTGIRHGTVTVLVDGLGVEVTTYRVDGTYTDARHPDSVAFTTELTDDLARRDFTVNAMAYSERGGFCDPFGGRVDLAARVIRAVGAAEERFREDALRILRAVRFAAVLGFEIEASTQKALSDCRDGLARIASERIFSELVRILQSRGAGRGIGLLLDAGLIPFVLPGYDTDRMPPLRGMEFLPDGAEVRLAYLLRWQEPEMAESILSFLKPSGAFVRTVRRLAVAQLPERIDEVGARRFAAEWGDLTETALTLIALDGTQPAEDAETILFHATQAIRRGDCLNMDSLALTGKDLIAAGYPPSPKIGRMLDALLEAVLENPRLNSRQALLSLAQTERIQNRLGKDGENI